MLEIASNISIALLVLAIGVPLLVRDHARRTLHKALGSSFGKRILTSQRWQLVFGLIPGSTAEEAIAQRVPVLIEREITRQARRR